MKMKPHGIGRPQMKVTPEMARMAAESFSSMSAEEISKAVASGGSSMPASAAGVSALPLGAQITPEMHKAAAEV